MALPVPRLDDRGWDQLVAEARALIPRNLPAWTDHNPSDPGITLLELFAFLAEISLYQLDRVPERTLRRFADLVSAASRPDLPLPERLREALDALERSERAVTAADFEALALAASPAVARSAVLVPAGADPLLQVVIVPDLPGDPAPVPPPALLESVFTFFQSRRLIATRVQAVPPDYTDIRIAATVVREADSALGQEEVRHAVAGAITAFLDPLTGGVEGRGWEFGRPVFRSEIYERIEGLPGVDHTRELLLNGDEHAGELPLSPADPERRARSLVRLARLDVTVVDA
jgi:hypothetical protein